MKSEKGSKITQKLLSAERRYSSPPLRNQIKLVFRRLQGIDHGNIMVSASARIAEGAVSSPVCCLDRVEFFLVKIFCRFKI
ncbi:hypothetical protein evm_012418 [Chilo suppressalis]|nr:hypothetical protein evm_012418 [Chilo suppressalis]